MAFFEKYGQKYAFDSLLFVAKGLRESQLDQEAKGRMRAVGIMQLMPTTGKELNVANISVAESNIHADAANLDQSMTRHFQDTHFPRWIARCSPSPATTQGCKH